MLGIVVWESAPVLLPLVLALALALVPESEPGPGPGPEPELGPEHELESESGVEPGPDPGPEPGPEPGLGRRWAGLLGSRRRELSIVVGVRVCMSRQRHGSMGREID